MQHTFCSECPWQRAAQPMWSSGTKEREQIMYALCLLGGGNYSFVLMKPTQKKMSFFLTAIKPHFLKKLMALINFEVCGSLKEVIGEVFQEQKDVFPTPLQVLLHYEDQSGLVTFSHGSWTYRLHQCEPKQGCSLAQDPHLCEPSPTLCILSISPGCWYPSWSAHVRCPQPHAWCCPLLPSPGMRRNIEWWLHCGSEPVVGPNLPGWLWSWCLHTQPLGVGQKGLGIK